MMEPESAAALLQQRLDDLEARMATIEESMVAVMGELSGKLREYDDPKTQILIGAFAIAARDPFNTGSWDKARKILSAMQAKYPDHAKTDPKPDQQP